MDRLAAMETFVRVVDTGSFSGAARQMQIGQPAVSKTIGQLEERLGVRLLLRSTRGLTPTVAGQQFYERARRAIEEADEADLAARGAGTTLTGRLRVSVPIPFTRIVLIPRLGEFLAQHPALEIELVMDDRQVDLVEEGVDLAVRMGKLADSGHTARKLGECERIVVAAPSYLAHAGTPKAPGELVGHDLVTFAQPSLGATWTFRRGTSEVSVAVRGRLRCSAAEGVRAAVIEGLGIAVGSEWLFGPELASGVVVPVLREWQLPSMDLWAVYPGGRMASAKARAFTAFVETIVAQLPTPAILR